MRGITITDQEDGNVLAFDLQDILRPFEAQVEASAWEISGVECVGDTADEFHELSDQKARIPGTTLLRLAASVVQVIDGVFRGYKEEQEHPWILIQAVDSSAYDVLSEDESVLAQLKLRFREVVDISD